MNDIVVCNTLEPWRCGNFSN